MLKKVIFSLLIFLTDVHDLSTLDFSFSGIIFPNLCCGHCRTIQTKNNSTIKTTYEKTQPLQHFFLFRKSKTGNL